MTSTQTTNTGDTSDSSNVLLTSFVLPLTTDEQFKALFQPQELLRAFLQHFSSSPSKGIDRLNGFQFSGRAEQEFVAVSRKCLDGSFRFTPYLENLKSKGRDKAPRLVSIPTIRDRVVLYQLNQVLASTFPDCVPRNVAKAYIADITQDLQVQDPNTTHVCGCDIKTFYDALQRERLFALLKGKLPHQAMHLVKHAVQTPTVTKNAQRRSYQSFIKDRGVPQGLAISNILAAIYLMDVDAPMRESGVRYFRYVDDVLMYGSEEKIRAAHRSLSARLRRRGLALHKLGAGKSHLDRIDKPFGFLGYYFALPRVTVRESSVEKLLQSIAAKFSDHIHNKKRRLERFKYLNDARLAEIFLLELNERISGAISERRRYGWIAYYGQINDLSLLHRLDHVVHGMFARLQDFEGKAPPSLKRFVRAYFEMKYNAGGSYVRNYDRIVTRAEKLSFLHERGKVGPDEALTDDQINARFDSYRRYVLSQMHADEQLLY